MVDAQLRFAAANHADLKKRRSAPAGVVVFAFLDRAGGAIGSGCFQEGLFYGFGPLGDEELPGRVQVVLTTFVDHAQVAIPRRILIREHAVHFVKFQRCETAEGQANSYTGTVRAGGGGRGEQGFNSPDGFGR